MATLAEIRAKLSAQEKTKQATPAQDGAIYAHWNIPEGSTATLRFLPDADDQNPYFWVERQMINLDFPGVLGQDETKKVTIAVPCVEMYDGKQKCPIHEIIRPWFKDPNQEVIARKYWKKRGYVMSGFVVNSPLTEDNIPENPIRRFVISPQIFALIKSSLMDAEIEEMPTDYKRGLDFRVNKTSKGGYADYSSSSWARKERALTADEQRAVDEHGLFNLSDYLPKRPDAEHLAAMVEMFHASVNGELYNPQRWARYYKPYGLTDVVMDPVATNPYAPPAMSKDLLKATQAENALEIIGKIKRSASVE